MIEAMIHDIFSTLRQESSWNGIEVVESTNDTCKKEDGWKGAVSPEVVSNVMSHCYDRQVRLNALVSRRIRRVGAFVVEMVLPGSRYTGKSQDGLGIEALLEKCDPVRNKC